MLDLSKFQIEAFFMKIFFLIALALSGSFQPRVSAAAEAPTVHYSISMSENGAIAEAPAPDLPVHSPIGLPLWCISRLGGMVADTDEKKSVSCHPKGGGTPDESFVLRVLGVTAMEDMFRITSSSALAARQALAGRANWFCAFKGFSRATFVSASLPKECEAKNNCQATLYAQIIQGETPGGTWFDHISSFRSPMGITSFPYAIDILTCEGQSSKH